MTAAEFREWMRALVRAASWNPAGIERPVDLVERDRRRREAPALREIREGERNADGE